VCHRAASNLCVIENRPLADLRIYDIVCGRAGGVFQNRCKDRVKFARIELELCSTVRSSSTVQPERSPTSKLVFYEICPSNFLGCYSKLVLASAAASKWRLRDLVANPSFDICANINRNRGCDVGEVFGGSASLVRV
jgi:hypothetical protein